MEVQTFEAVERDSDMTPECCEEQRSLIDSLDLTAQKELISPNTEQVINPYHKMTDEQDFVYRTLYPKEVGIKDYGAGPIPVRVLQVIAYCDKHELFSRGMSIWCPNGPINADPVLVGGISYSINCLLARWGDALEDYNILLQRACEIRRHEIKEELLKCRDQVTAYMNRLDDMSWQSFNSKGIPSTYNME